MDELVCKECRGRRFRKISATEYECEYCGAIIKEAPKPGNEKIVIIQQVQPQPIVSPFPNEISYTASLREGFNTLNGKLVIYPDKFSFVPQSVFNTGNLSPREWKIVDITGYVKGMITFLDIKMTDNKKIHLAIQWKRKIIKELEARRKYWLEKQQ